MKFVKKVILVHYVPNVISLMKEELENLLDQEELIAKNVSFHF